MGQSSSSHSPSPPWSTHRSNSSSFRSSLHKDDVAIEYPFLSSGDRKRCSLVSRRWLLVEGQSRHRLALNAQSEIVPLIPMIFSRCVNLTRLKLRGCREVTDVGMAALAERCKYLRKLHIDGWKTNRIGNEALIAIAKHSVNLQELVLIGVNPSTISLEAIASNCQKLERLALCGSETIADSEISCIASKCVALKKLCIKGCPVSDEGIEAFAWGCPNLIKIKVKKCRNVTGEVGDWLRARRGSLVVNLDVCAVEVENVDASASDGAQEDVTDLPTITSDVAVAQPERLATSSSGRGSVFRTRFGLFGARGLVSGTFRKWSIGNSSSSGTS
nr:F-box protein SKIP2-like [Tanacetum cinerariifolium]